jgi:hypothetical protein
MAQKIYPLMINPEDTDENPLTHYRLMAWLADTGYVEGFLYKKISPLDMPYVEDYIQEVWVQILSVPPERMMYMWYKGKGAFTNYIKAIVTNNIISTNSHVYNNIRKGVKDHIHLDDAGWNHLDNDEEADAYLQFATWEKSTNPTTGRQKKVPTINYEKITVKANGYNQEG